VTTKTRKICIKILVILAAVVTGVLLLRAILNYTTGKKLENYLAKAKAEGIPLNMRDIAPRCPDSENAASLWKAAEALFILPEEKDRKLAAEAIGAFFDRKSLDGTARRSLTQLSEKNRRVFELIAEASSRPCFKYGDWTKSPWSIEQIKAIKTIQATRLLGIDSVLQAEAGRVQEGLEECRNGMHFVRKLLGEPWLLNNLVALAEMKFLLICFNQIAWERDIDPVTLAAWMNEMDIDSWRGQSIRWIPMERLIGLEWGLRAIGEKPGDLSAALSSLGDEKGIDRFFYWLVRPVLKSQFIWVHKKFGELERVARESYYRQIDFLKGEQVERVPWYYKPTGVLLPDFRGVFLKEATLEAMMLTTKAGLACRIYRQKYGRYPENLAALVPELSDSEPIDPFTGKPLIYKMENGELLIYSLGSNEKDDGGRGTYMITQLVMEKDDDWTWREKIR
jgi:hypothetical protein